MRLPRPRLTTRGLMRLVLSTGIVLGVIHLIERHEYARRKIHDHMGKWAEAEAYIRKHPGAPRMERAREYHDRMVDKWMKAAGRPWFPFEDDPSAPE